MFQLTGEEFLRCQNVTPNLRPHFATSRAGLDWLSESINKSKVKNIKILMSSEKLNDKFISLYKDLKEELKNYGVQCELRVIADIHDRWIISENLCYNMPSTDTVARGQYSEVKRTPNFPPFN